ncbi:putative quorum-sensing-regulated virulence factor [Peredibacter sp. HCB2-198]|uniref:putative quorum-sensing-regulated virulence factor n=1 Tax=Peredibacter sp. HCB2-198 TaxID=3383025 RepID=UPI0038B51B2C
MMNELEKLKSMAMPFGKYKGVPLIDLPEPYVVWFYTNGLPEGELGKLLGLLYEIKLNGLEHLIKPIGRQN